MKLIEFGKSNKTKRSMFFLVFMFLLLACGESEEQKEEDFEESTRQTSTNGKNTQQGSSTAKRALPEVHGLNLAKLFTKSQELNLHTNDAENKCAWTEEMGVFGIPLGVACNSVPLVSEILYGTSEPDKNADGAVTCADYVYGADDQGILFDMLCHPGMKVSDKVESLRFAGENSEEIAISFKDFDPDDQFSALGHWSANGPDVVRYPANIKAWYSQGEEADLQGILAMELESSQQGKISLDGRAAGHDIVGEIQFGRGADVSKCEEDPSKSTCIWQDIKISIPSEESLSIHLFIMSNKKTDADFVFMEGKILLNEVASAKWFTGEDEFGQTLKDTREIYFRTVVKPEQIWGAIDFQDDSSERLNGPDSVNVVLDLLRDGPSETAYAGVCQNQNSNNVAPCEQIDYLDYSTLWTSDEFFEPAPLAFELDIDFNNIPEQQGLKQLDTSAVEE